MATILTEEEAKKLGPRPFGKKHHIRIMLEKLEIGQILYITRADFNWKKQNPNIFIKPLMKATGKKFEISIVANKTGWIVKRIE